MNHFDALQTSTHESPLTQQILLSLFTNLREDDGLNQREGWWGHALDGQTFGSKLWLIEREKLTAETLEKATLYAKESLNWIIDSNVAEELHVKSEFIKNGILISIQLTFPNGTKTNHKFEVR
jgi:phage gp46-like protein